MQPLVEIVWDGRGELTFWPDRDYAVMRGEGWDLIWDRPPLTSAYLWTLRMGRDYHHDDHRTFSRGRVSTQPVSITTDRQKRFDETWARLARMLESPPKAPEPIHAQPRKPEPVQPLDAGLYELRRAQAAQAQTGDSREFTLCAHTSKVKHRSKLWALHHRNTLAFDPTTAHPERLEAYKCSWCGGWHVGHRVAA
jgi:hypothetical protein